jgi:hypothetical protein
MKAQSRYLAYFIMVILAWTTLGAEVCFAGDILIAKASFSTQKYPYSADSTAKKLRREMDLESLEQRVRTSSALGILDKIKLKFEVDGLIQSVSNFHNDKSNESIKVLRARYEGLLSNVLELLQKDTELRQEFSSSREALWKILLDPVLFVKR